MSSVRFTLYYFLIIYVAIPITPSVYAASITAVLPIAVIASLFFAIYLFSYLLSILRGKRSSLSIFIKIINTVIDFI